jgi:hypothetical protein
VNNYSFAQLEEMALQAESQWAEDQAQQEQAAQAAYEAGRARLRAQVLDFLVRDQHLDRDELDAALVVDSADDDLWPDVALNIPRHARIALRLRQVMAEGEAEGDVVFHLAWDGRTPFQVEGETSYLELSHAVLAAGRAYRDRLAREAEESRSWQLYQARQAAHQAAEEAEKVGRIGRVAALLAACPPLGPMLDVLLGWVAEHARFAAELEAANEWAAAIEQRLGRKLAAARDEADRLAQERNDLERQKWELADQVAAAERQARRGR